VKVVYLFAWQNERYVGVSIQRVPLEFAKEVAEVVVGVLERREPPNRLTHV